MKGKHLTHKRLYGIWVDMRRRCSNEKRADYKWYGARGISVCQEWQRCEYFFEWALSSGYADDLTLDREDVDGNYEPDNCRWTTIKQQERNRRNNRRISFNGETLCMSEWAEKIGVSPACLRNRLTLGWSVDRALAC